MLNIIGSQNHGKQILKEYYKKTAWGIIKSKVEYAFWWVAKWGAVSVFVLGGWCAGDVLTQIIKF